MSSVEEQAKAAGNKLVSQGDYQGAILEYTKGLEASNSSSSVRHLLFSNRAMCYAELKEWEKSLDDARSCVLSSPSSYSKGWLRVAFAAHNLPSPVRAGFVLKARKVKQQQQEEEEGGANNNNNKNQDDLLFEKLGNSQKEQQASSTSSASSSSGNNNKSKNSRIKTIYDDAVLIQFVDKALSIDSSLPGARELRREIVALQFQKLVEDLEIFPKVISQFGGQQIPNTFWDDDVAKPNPCPAVYLKDDWKYLMLTINALLEPLQMKTKAEGYQDKVIEKIVPIFECAKQDAVIFDALQSPFSNYHPVFVAMKKLSEPHQQKERIAMSREHFPVSFKHFVVHMTDAFKLMEKMIELGFSMHDSTESADAKSGGTRSVLHCTLDRGAWKLTKILLESKPGQEHDWKNTVLCCGKNPLQHGVQYGHRGLVKYLLSLPGIDVNCVDPPAPEPKTREEIEHRKKFKPIDRNNLLHHCASLGFHEIAKILIEEGKINVNYQNSVGQTPLMWAINAEDIKMMELFLNSGADTELKQYAGYNARDAAINTQNPDVIFRFDALVEKLTGKKPGPSMLDPTGTGVVENAAKMKKGEGETSTSNSTSSSATSAAAAS